MIDSRLPLHLPKSEIVEGEMPNLFRLANYRNWKCIYMICNLFIFLQFPKFRLLHVMSTMSIMKYPNIENGDVLFQMVKHITSQSEFFGVMI